MPEVWDDIDPVVRANLIRLSDASGGHVHRAGACPECGMKLVAVE